MTEENSGTMTNNEINEAIATILGNKTSGDDPDWANDISAAFSLIMSLGLILTSATQEERGIRKLWKATIPYGMVGIAETPSRAICLAFLERKRKFAEHGWNDDISSENT